MLLVGSAVAAGNVEHEKGYLFATLRGADSMLPVGVVLDPSVRVVM